MALYIPPAPKTNPLDASSDLSHTSGEEGRLGPRRGVKWSDTDIRHNLYMRLERGDFGNLKPHQVAGIQKIIDQARGADHTLEPSKVLRVIHQLETSRVDLELDHGVLEGIVSHLSQGPED